MFFCRCSITRLELDINLLLRRALRSMESLLSAGRVSYNVFRLKASMLCKESFGVGRAVSCRVESRAGISFFVSLDIGGVEVVWGSLGGASTFSWEACFMLVFFCESVGFLGSFFWGCRGRLRYIFWLSLVDSSEAFLL